MTMTLRTIAIGLALVIGLGWGLSARADMGVATIYSQGGLLQTASPTTNVSMDDEKVVLTYGQPQTDDLGNLMTAHVTAVFTMKNNGSRSEDLAVYFPASDSAFVDGIGNQDGNDITNFKVNGRTLGQESLGNVTAVINGNQQTIDAYTWSVTFASQQSVQVTIEYDTKSGQDLNAYHLTYVLGTGRGWQGPIKNGTVTFALPKQLAAYSVTDESFYVSDNSDLPHTIDGNKVIVSFTNYEPEPDAVISLGVYDIGIVEQIEQLKTEPATFENTLAIAGLFQDLTQGGHCVFCTTTTTEYALDYYNRALDKATTEDQLNEVLMSFVYRGWNDVSIASLLEQLSFNGCATDDIECKANMVVDRGQLGETPISYGYTEQGLENADFLSAYAEKMSAYDPAVSAVVNNYVNDGSAISALLQEQDRQNQLAQPQAVSGTPSESDSPDANLISTLTNTTPESAKATTATQKKGLSRQMVGLGLAFILAALTVLILIWKGNELNPLRRAKKQSIIVKMIGKRKKR